MSALSTGLTEQAQLVHARNNLLFRTIGEHLEKNEFIQARRMVDMFILKRVDQNTGDEELLSHILATALMERIGKKLLESKNIYLQKFDIPQILLFYKMTLAYPQVAGSHSLANQYLASIAVRYEHVTLFDIGIGKGKQMEALLELIGSRPYKCREIVIIGLDPDNENLRDAEELYKSIVGRFRFELKFIPVCNLIENCSKTDWKFIKTIGRECLLINASYAMHHILHPLHDTGLRLDIFRKLHDLDPRLFTLLEPNADHDVENVAVRMRNCREHFGQVFRLISEADIGAEHKFLIKEKFFGREIKNILSVSDYLRSERHETLDTWLLRLTMAGFVPCKFRGLHVNLPEYCEVHYDEGLVEMGYKELPLIGVFAYKPKTDKE